ncbi:MAG TPA: proton-conducting transporter membrane subunit [Pirellulaceae bacterium]|nr:proton-conducting transporter membrane subunit [Pirellulaceae bacterium]
MAELLVCLPVAWAALAFAVPSNRWRPWVLPAGGLVQLVLAARALQETNLTGWDNWLNLDPLGRIFLGLISVLFFLCACYAPGYLAQRSQRDNRVLCACLLLSLSMMTLIILSHHLGLMWVAMEATTLISAPGLYFNHNPRSLEATWKFLLICSVGIALALMGSLFLAYAALHSGLKTSLLFDDLVRQAPLLSRPWMHAAFVFLFVGYGTKMGLAPMHTWKPDAYGEAPGMIGALLAGGITNCAFLCILRFVHITNAAHDAQFAHRMMVFVGLLSIGVGAAFMVRQRDFKRMLAYSSVEHMGILVLGIGIGGAATWAALLHAINNGLTKGILFLSAGNIHRAYETKLTADVRGVIRRLPVSGWLFLLGFLAITGSPPFAPFVSEFSLLAAAFRQGRFVEGALFAIMLLVVFIGFGATVTSMVFGAPSPAATSTAIHDSAATCWPIVAFAVLVLVLGVYLPPPLATMLRDAAMFLEGAPSPG